MLHRRLQGAADFSERNYSQVIERIDRQTFIRLYSSHRPSVRSTLSPLVLWFFSMYSPCVRHL
jgi:hypothetical protein